MTVFVNQHTPAAERPPTVFISYARQDGAFVQRLLKAIDGAGHAYWFDENDIEVTSDWMGAIADGIGNSYAVIVICSHHALDRYWVRAEYSWALNLEKPIIPVLIEDVTKDKNFFGLHLLQPIRFDKIEHDRAVETLIQALARLTTPVMPPLPRPVTRRERELAYLERLKLNDFLLEKFELAEYAALAGVAHARAASLDDWDRLAMQQQFAVIRHVIGDRETEAPPRTFTDAVTEITALRRAVVLGEPGAGKTHTLRAIAKPLYTAALTDPAAPIPILVKLGNWDKADMPFETFLREALGELGGHLDELLTPPGAESPRAVLLLDGLNEFPADQRAAKYPQVEAFIKSHPAVMAVVTCREADYTVDLRMNRVIIRPLDVFRIRDFAERALRAQGADAGTTFFWRLAGEGVEAVWQKWAAAGADFTLFWTAQDVPRADPNVYNSTSSADDALWKETVHGAAADRSLLRLASNPYMLRMLLDVYVQFKGSLPANRGQLFDQFVTVLLQREKLARIDPATQSVTRTAEAEALLTGLMQIAYRMQVRAPHPPAPSPTPAGRGGEAGAGTALPMAEVRAVLNERLLYLAVSASILIVGEEARFSHQLLQEYFAARYMDGEIRAGRLRAAEIWKPVTWWERTNWEEAVILLAGLYSNDCTEVLNWLADANPEVAALCIARSGAHTPDVTRIRLRDRWLSRLTDVQGEPDPQSRAAVGRALGLFTIDNLPADNRRGVTVIRRDGVLLPDLAWGHVPAGAFAFGEGDAAQTLSIDYDFWIARYPVTYAQYALFVEDGGYSDRWRTCWTDGGWAWKGTRQHPSAYWQDPQWHIANHPVVGVTWYEAYAYSRWADAVVTDKPAGTILRLPTEGEWEKAARYPDGRRYPWGDDYLSGYANIDETNGIGPHYLGRTSAVGIYPQGAHPAHGAHDQSGNVWEWCLTKWQNNYQHPGDSDPAGGDARGVRGGSWDLNQDVARAAFRYRHDPNSWVNLRGFRLAASFPI